MSFVDLRKQPRCPLADNWIRKLWYMHTMECDYFWPMPAFCDAVFALELFVKLKTPQPHTFPVQSVLHSLTCFINVRSAS